MGNFNALCLWSSAANAIEATRAGTGSAHEVRMTGTPRNNSSGKRSPCEIFGILHEHIAGNEIRHQDDVGITRHVGGNPLLFRGSCRDRIVECQRPIDQDAGNLAAPPQDA